MRARLFVGLLVLLFSNSAIAQVSGQLPAQRSAAPAATQAWSKNSPIQQQIMSLLQNPTYQKELEMTEEQISAAREMTKKLSEGYKEIYARYPQLKDTKLDYKQRSEIYKKLQAEYAELRKEVESELMEQLVPNQKVILKKIEFNQAVRYYGVSAALTRNPYAEQFGTTDKQKQELLKIRQETEAEILKLIEEKRKAAKEKMLKVLDAKQRKQFKELEGDIKRTGYTRL